MKKTILFFFVFVCFFMIWADIKQESETETVNTSNPDKTGTDKMTYIQAEEYCKKQELALPTPSKVASDKDLKEVDACFWVTGGGKDKRICYNPKKHSYGRIMRDEDIQSVFCVRDENKKVDGASKRLWD